MTVYNKHLHSQCNLISLIEQVEDKNKYPVPSIEHPMMMRNRVKILTIKIPPIYHIFWIYIGVYFTKNTLVSVRHCARFQFFYLGNIFSQAQTNENDDIANYSKY